MICCGSPSAGFIVPREARMKTGSALGVLAVAVMACCFLPFWPWTRRTRFATGTQPYRLQVERVALGRGR